jgi:hypothetical protein
LLQRLEGFRGGFRNDDETLLVLQCEGETPVQPSTTEAR